MRDLLSKLDAIISETALKDKADLAAKRQALDDLESDPVAGKDPEISSAIDQRRSDLEREAKSKGIEESIYEIGDDFGISFSEDFEISSEIVDILEDGIVINLDEYAIDYLTKEGLQFVDVQIDEEKQKGLDGKACWKGYKRMGTKMKGGKRVDNCVKIKEGFGTLEDEVKKLLDRFEQNAMEIGAYGNPDIEGIASLIAQGDYEGAADEVYGSYADQDGGEVPRLEPMIQDLQDEFEALGDIDPDMDPDEGGETDDNYALASAGFGSDEDYESIENEAKYQGREVPLGKPMKGDVKKSKVYVKNPQGNVVKVNFGDKKMRIKKSNPNRRKSFRARHNCANPGPRHKARYWSCRAW